MVESIIQTMNYIQTKWLIFNFLSFFMQELKFCSRILIDINHMLLNKYEFVYPQ
jgi:hypothetical protein